MSRLLFFMLVSANGYYERGPWEIDWHVTDEEFNDFAAEQLDSVGTLVFGRRTYEGMAAYWPGADAIRDDPIVAGKMNGLPKIVVSRTLERAEWSNTRIARSTDELARLVRGLAKDAIVFGSSDLASTLAAEGLIDEYRIMVNPIALAHGKPLFKGLVHDLRLKLTNARTFGSGNVLDARA